MILQERLDRRSFGLAGFSERAVRTGAAAAIRLALAFGLAAVVALGFFGFLGLGGVRVSLVRRLFSLDRGSGHFAFRPLFIIFHEGLAEGQAADGAGTGAGRGFAGVADSGAGVGFVQHLLDIHGGVSPAIMGRARVNKRKAVRLLSFDCGCFFFAKNLLMVKLKIAIDGKW
ncbi:hypothetical protein HYV43_07440 [Candidatus Micrarchaeota archaeon]|nr:hypothetical protein [Candidatus Micrarchaeota archaeon]